MPTESYASTSYIDHYFPSVVHASVVHKVAKPSHSDQESPSQSNSRPNAPIEPPHKSTGMQNIREGLLSHLVLEVK